MNVLLYLAHSKAEIAYEAIYSILSYLKVSEQLAAEEQAQIVVYTDQEALFRTYLDNVPKPIHYVPLTPEKLNEWRGSINFVHRGKIKLLEDFFSRDPASRDPASRGPASRDWAIQEAENVLFVDTDTVFLQDVRPLFQQVAQGKLVMHSPEGRLDSGKNLIFKKMYRTLKAHNFAFQSADGQRVAVPATTEMWNSGVLGLNEKSKGLLQQVLHFTDTVYPHMPKHIIEQLAYSFHFGQHGPPAPADAYIYHYWNFKEYRPVLTDFFTAQQDKTTAELISRMHRIDPRELIKPKEAYDESRGLNRIVRKLMGKWKMPRYEC
jgi:hypothetical protein